MPADIAHRYWLSEYDLAVGLAKGQVKAKGPVSKILKLVHHGTTVPRRTASWSTSTEGGPGK